MHSQTLPATHVKTEPASDLRLSLLGAPQILFRGQPLAPRLSQRATALFFYLVLEPRKHSRGDLATLLWPDMPVVQAKKNLRNILPELRKELGEYLLISNTQLAIRNQEHFWCDVHALRTLLTEAKKEENVSKILDAATLLQGEFLSGFFVSGAPAFEDWIEIQRQRILGLLKQDLHQLTLQLLEKRQFSAGIRVLRKFLEIDPLNEAAHQLLMRFLNEDGQRNAALMHYENFQQVLMNELGVEPDSQTQALASALRKVDVNIPPKLHPVSNNPFIQAPKPQNIVPATSAPQQAHKHNLPGQLTSFVGREQDISEICALLLDPVIRLTTLVGEGGIGKTRLAFAVAQQIQTDFQDGIWFVPLVGIAEAPDLPDRLANAIAAAMHHSFSGQTSLTDQLFRALRNKTCLLILDSFEHLLASADFILDLLNQTEKVKILVTSRHILNFQMEHIWRVDILPTPPLHFQETLTPEMLLRYDCVELFVERARRVVRDFTVNQTNHQDIATICQFVHGLPLGIELAAALTRHYSCAEIADTLHHNYAILATTQRDVAPRHQSIQATLAYSWNFLSKDQARIAAQCSIFRGGFTQEAAEKVIKTDRAMLNDLEDHSLLRVVRDQAGQKRYDMHELVRQYAASQLQAIAGLTEATQAQFCGYYTEFMHTRIEALVQGRQAQNEMQSELNNIRQTWQWLTEKYDIPAISQSTDGLFRFYYLLGMYQEGEKAAQAAVTAVRHWLAIHDTTAAEPLLSKAHFELARSVLTQARFCERIGQLDRAQQLTEDGIAQAQAIGAIELEARGYLGIASLAQIRRDYLTLRMMGEKMIALVEAGGFPALEGVRVNSYGLKFIGVYHVHSNEFPQAQNYFERGLQLAQQIQDRELESMLFNNLGVIHGMLGDFSQALSNYHQCLAICHTLSERSAEGLAMINLGETYQALGDWEQAKNYIGGALALYHAIGYPLYEAKAWARLGRIALATGNGELAHSYLVHARGIAQAANIRAIEAELLSDLGHILLSLKRSEEAAAIYQQALSEWQKLSALQAAIRVQAGLAETALLQGDVATALGYGEAILSQLTEKKLNANFDPIFVYWVCYRVLTANQDTRAEEALQQGYALLQQYSQKIEDAELRQSFRSNIRVNREIRRILEGDSI